MSRWQAFFDRLSVLIHQAVAGNELWRFIASLGVLVIGFIILETLWRSANRQIKASVEKPVRFKKSDFDRTRVISSQKSGVDELSVHVGADEKIIVGKCVVTADGTIAK